VLTDDPALFKDWLKATTLGWLLGFFLVVMLAVAWDQLGGSAQFMVGIGMGAGVASLQGRVLRRLEVDAYRWVAVTTLGMGLPFLLWDLSAAKGLDVFFSLPSCVVVGSALAGALQSPLLRPRSGRTSLWIPASVIGWGLPAGGIALADAGALSGGGALVSLGAMFLGGPVLGAVTGQALVRLPVQDSDPSGLARTTRP
jgi:hypothetical protein